jgi:hypothetical protein
MTEQPVYRKPGTGRRVMYFVLLFVPIVALLYFGVGAIGLMKGLGALTKLHLMDKQGQVEEMAMRALFEGLHPPGELLTQLHSPIDRKAISSLVQDRPGLVEIGTIKGGKYRAAVSYVESEKVRAEISKLARVVSDTVSWHKTYTGVSPDLDYEFNVSPVKINGGSFTFTFCNLGDEIGVVVTEVGKVKSVLQEIFEGMKETNQVLFEDYFGYYPGTYTAEIKLYDEAGENFFTFGRGMGEGWDDIWESGLMYVPWRMTVQLFSQNAWEVKQAETARKVPWVGIALLVVAVVMVFLLGHLSPRLHGFRLGKDSGLDKIE